MERWVKFCADSKNSTELEKQFASISLQAATTKVEGNTIAARAPSKLQRQDPQRTLGPPHGQAELGIILIAMRKLREATVATARKDLFAQKAYIFIIRTAILLKNMESYHPALLHLLNHIHPVCPLPAPELHEFTGYHILDLACRQGDFTGAYAAKQHFGYHDRRVEKTLNALVHDNWVVYWLVKGKVDGYVRALMEWAEERLRLHALKCLGRSYFTAEKTYVEKCANMDWEDLVKTMQVGWQLDGEKVTIRRPKTT